jgi:MoaA/NifB/PqqE/SkfB family radical SAM enzyme
MGDRYRMDGHKLIHHIPRVHAWLEGRIVYPVYMEISPSGACNHRCRFCAKDFMGYQGRFLDADLFKQRLEEMAGLGVKSMMYAGEGEPLLHPRIEEFIAFGASVGIDQAMTTNGVLLVPERAQALLPHMKWIRVSIDAGTPETHALLHNTSIRDFDTILENLREAAALRRANGWDCTLGAQVLLLPENRREVRRLAELLRDRGVDYLAVKPYSQHPHSHNCAYEEVSYEDAAQLKTELEGMSTPDFQVILRLHAMKKWDDADHGYARCLALPFWAYVDAGGNVWGCSNHLEEDNFLYGNLNEQSFKEIWEGERRLTRLHWAEESLDARTCRLNCRMDEVNRFLWELKTPPPHVNFI